MQKADFVVSTWFCSIEDPFNIAMRKSGQRWIKITYFRDLDLLMTPQARFPIDLVGEVRGESPDAAILREMLMGSKIIEGGGCGFNPKAPRDPEVVALASRYGDPIDLLESFV